MNGSVKTYALFVPELKELIREKQLAELKAALRDLNPVDLAEGWKQFTPEEQVVVFKLLGTRKSVVVFEELDVAEQTLLLSALEETVTTQLVSEIGPEEAAHLFRRLPRKVVKRLTNLIKREETAKVLQAVTSYPPSTAGALMHAGAVLLRRDMTAFQALETIRTLTKKRSHEEGLLAVLYVTEPSGRLGGGVTLQDLVAAPRDSLVSEIMHPVQLVKIGAEVDQEEAAKVFSRYNLVSAPVVDKEDRLVGVLLVDDMMEVLQSEATEDIAKMAGTSARTISSESLWGFSTARLTMLRSPWLAVTLVVQLVVSMVVQNFEGLLGRVVALVSFMPPIQALGGNVGSQSGTIVVRGLATGELHDGDFGASVWREFRVGGLIGLLFGASLASVAWFQYGFRFGSAFPLVVGSGVLVSMTMASTMGGTWPFLLKRLGLDPATAMGPLITTATDLLSLLAYLTFAAALL